MSDTLAEVTHIHLFLAIILLMLLLKLFNIAYPLFDTALFACISTPASYTLAYYHARAYKIGKFVREKNPETVRLWSYELVALLVSFIMGYTVFVALTGSTDYIVFSAAFITVQIMRCVTIIMVRNLAKMGVDVQHPGIVVLVALSVASLGLIGLSIFPL
ncbi:MAG: hypothetical protein DRN90_00320 [Thermoproteota archaeon]|nr:MAG: hypothetical protein DRN90_00320 [Candidatus Korarchaeota archaeon]